MSTTSHPTGDDYASLSAAPTATPSSSSSSSSSLSFMIAAHDSILQFLQCEKNDESEPSNVHVSAKCDIQVSPQVDAPLSCAELVALALKCDKLLYDNDNENCNRSMFLLFPTATQALLRLGQGNNGHYDRIAAATLLALHQLESAIRTCTGHCAGKAPLLKTMLQQMQQQQQSSLSSSSFPTTSTTSNTNLSYILQGLLLPTGLNLRNLLWHGFCGGLPRPWLSLTVCLTHSIRLGCRAQGSSSSSSSSSSHPKASMGATRRTRATTRTMEEEKTRTMPDVSDLAAMAATRRRRRNGGGGGSTNVDRIVQAWLPSSHHNLWQLARDWISSDQYPACSMALLSILLEHGLRVRWCHANQRPDNAVAQPRCFYVTLDGHGQRHVHDILVHPYCSNGNNNNNNNNHNSSNNNNNNEEGSLWVKNALISQGYLDANAAALIADLFCSASGPNIRAAACHGLWDDYLEEELERMGQNATTTSTTTTTTTSYATNNTRQSNYSEIRQHLSDYLAAILLAMEMAASSCPSGDRLVTEESALVSYRPRFSYTATTRQSLVDCQLAMNKLLGAQGDYVKMEMKHGMPAFMSKLVVPRKWIEDALQTTIDRLTCANGDDTFSGWTIEKLYREHDLNQHLAPMGATQHLVRDVAEALNKLNAELQEARQLLDSHDANLTTRQRRRYQRVLTCDSVGALFYGFAASIALLSLQDAMNSESRWNAKDSLKMVERSRMVVSTVSNFLTSNTDRAYKAMEEYTKGRVLNQHIFSYSDELFV